MNQDFTNANDRALATALSWIARLRAGPTSPQDRQSFALWLAADASHPQAMDSMLDMWDDLGSVQHLPFPAQLTQPAANQRNWLAASVAVAFIDSIVCVTNEFCSATCAFWVSIAADCSVVSSPV